MPTWLRRLPAAQLPGVAGRERRRRRVHDDEQGLQHGRLARRLLLPAIAEMVKALATIKGYYDYGMFQAVQIAAIVALRHGEAGVETQSRIYQSRRDVLVDGLRRLGWDDHAAEGRHVRLGEDPRAVAAADEHDGLRHDAAGKGQRRRQPRQRLRPAGEGYLRMSLVENEARLRQAVRQIQRCLREVEPQFAKELRSPASASSATPDPSVTTA